MGKRGRRAAAPEAGSLSSRSTAGTTTTVELGDFAADTLTLDSHEEDSSRGARPPDAAGIRQRARIASARVPTAAGLASSASGFAALAVAACAARARRRPKSSRRGAPGQRVGGRSVPAVGGWRTIGAAGFRRRTGPSLLLGSVPAALSNRVARRNAGDARELALPCGLDSAIAAAISRSPSAAATRDLSGSGALAERNALRNACDGARGGPALLYWQPRPSLACIAPASCARADRAWGRSMPARTCRDLRFEGRRSGRDQAARDSGVVDVLLARRPRARCCHGVRSSLREGVPGGEYAVLEPRQPALVVGRSEAAAMPTGAGAGFASLCADGVAWAAARLLRSVRLAARAAEWPLRFCGGRRRSEHRVSKMISLSDGRKLGLGGARLLRPAVRAVCATSAGRWARRGFVPGRRGALGGAGGSGSGADVAPRAGGALEVRIRGSVEGRRGGDGDGDAEIAAARPLERQGAGFPRLRLLLASRRTSGYARRWSRGPELARATRPRAAGSGRSPKQRAVRDSLESADRLATLGPFAGAAPRWRRRYEGTSSDRHAGARPRCRARVAAGAAGKRAARRRGCAVILASVTRCDRAEPLCARTFRVPCRAG